MKGLISSNYYRKNNINNDLLMLSIFRVNKSVCVCVFQIEWNKKKKSNETHARS